MWKYSQSTGELTSPAGSSVGHGYSGHGDGVNNPALQNVEKVGPIPQGLWSIGQFFYDIGGKGPIVAHLTPMPETNTFSRSGFMIHGDNEELNHTASEGCIILPRGIRQMMEVSLDRSLLVVE